MKDNTDYKVTYEKPILGQGAESFCPPLPRINQQQIFTLQRIRTYIAKSNCKLAGIIGGGFIRLVAAENLNMLGLMCAWLKVQHMVFLPSTKTSRKYYTKGLKIHNVHLHTMILFLTFGFSWSLWTRINYVHFVLIVTFLHGGDGRHCGGDA